MSQIDIIANTPASILLMSAVEHPNFFDVSHVHGPENLRALVNRLVELYPNLKQDPSHGNQRLPEESRDSRRR